MRNREYSLFDGRQLGSAIKTSRVDTGTGVLMPVVDPSRNIVYLAGRVRSLCCERDVKEAKLTRRTLNRAT